MLDTPILAAFNGSSGHSEPLDQTKIDSTDHREGDREEMAIRKPKTGQDFILIRLR